MVVWLYPAKETNTMNDKQIYITIDNKPAYRLMWQAKAKTMLTKYGYKMCEWFHTSGHWMSDEELAAYLSRPDEQQ